MNSLCAKVSTFLVVSNEPDFCFYAFFCAFCTDFKWMGLSWEKDDITYFQAPN